MEALIALDTHVAVWLHAGEVQRLPEKTYQRLDCEELVICPIVLLEMEYLREIDRITVSAERIFADLSMEIGLRLCDHPFNEIIRESLVQNWTRDPFDRLISAHAVVAGHDLVTRDNEIHRHCSAAFWD